MFAVRVEHPGLAIPCRVTWILTTKRKSESGCATNYTLDRQLTARVTSGPSVVHKNRT